MTYKSYYQNKSPFSGIFALFAFIMFFVLLYFIAKGIFTILSYAAIPLIILAAILDYKVIVNYVKYLLNMFSRSPISAILLTAFTIIGFPLVSAFLAFRAFISRKVGNIQEEIEREENTFTEFEEIHEDFLELPDIEIETKEADTEYDDLFKE